MNGVHIYGVLILQGCRTNGSHAILLGQERCEKELNVKNVFKNSPFRAMLLGLTGCPFENEKLFENVRTRDGSNTCSIDVKFRSSSIFLVKDFVGLILSLK